MSEGLKEMLALLDGRGVPEIRAALLLMLFTPDPDRAVFAETVLDRLIAAVRTETIEECAKVALSHGHVPPFNESVELDRIAAYSTKTCQMIADRIRSLGSTKDAGD